MESNQKDSKIFPLLVIGALVVLVVMGGIAFFTQTKPEIKSFSIEKGQFVVTGVDLTKVYIWGTPTGTGITSADNVLIDTMSIAREDKNNQRWFALIPKQPLLLTSVVAIGYNRNGRAVGTVSLPYTGASEINEALWGSSSQSPTSTPIIKK